MQSNEVVARNLNLALLMLDTDNEKLAYELIIKTADVLKNELQPATAEKNTIDEVVDKKLVGYYKLEGDTHFGDSAKVVE